MGKNRSLQSMIQSFKVVFKYHYILKKNCAYTCIAMSEYAVLTQNCEVHNLGNVIDFELRLQLITI